MQHCSFCLRKSNEVLNIIVPNLVHHWVLRFLLGRAARVWDVLVMYNLPVILTLRMAWGCICSTLPVRLFAHKLRFRDTVARFLLCFPVFFVCALFNLFADLLQKMFAKYPPEVLLPLNKSFLDYQHNITFRMQLNCRFSFFGCICHVIIETISSEEVVNE